MDQKRVDEIYRIIERLQIDLDPDPTILGPRYIMDKVAKCRNNVNIVSQIRQTIARERRELKRQLAGEEAMFSIERDQLLASDETVRRQPNIRDREAVVNTLLRERLYRISNLKADIMDLDTVEQPVKMVHDELTRTATEIRTQRSMIQADRISGAGYGDESEKESRGLIQEDSIDEDELDRIMREEAPLVVPKTITSRVIPDLAHPEISEPSKAPEVPLVVQEVSVSEASIGVPEETPANPEEVLGSLPPEVSESSEDPDIAKFLAKEEPVVKTKPKPSKKSKADPPPEQSEDGINFEDILKGL